MASPFDQENNLNAFLDNILSYTELTFVQNLENAYLLSLSICYT
jgi:hypothetical protein